MSDSFLFATPPPRAGPSSRLLKRRSQAQQAQLQPPQMELSRVSLSPASPGMMTTTMLGRTSFLDNSTRMMDAADVTRPIYTYKAATTPISNDRRVQLDHEIEATENLFVDFFASCTGEEALAAADDNDNGLAVLDQVAEFEQLLSEQVAALHKAIVKDPFSNRKETVAQVKENLKKELHSWRIIGKLFGDRLTRASESMMLEEGEINETGDGEGAGNSKPLSEKQVVEHLFRKEQDLREAQAIVDWLETNAKETFGDLYSESDIFGDSLLGWENTLHALQTRQSASSSLVTELDPDAKVRQGKLLHDLDEHDQQRLTKVLYLCLRAGLMETAQELCLKMGQPWRVATLNGWKLFHDPNVGTDNGSEKLPVEGNTNRDVWKNCAWNLSKDESLPAYERGIYSALCGNAQQLLTSGLCPSWEDKLWVLTRCLVDVRVEREIRGALAKKFVDLPSQYWDNKDNLAAILHSVTVLEQDAAASEARAHRSIQSFIMLQEWDKLYEHVWSTAKSASDPHLLRFLAHLVLVLRRLGIECEKRSLDEEVLEAYISYLVQSGKVRQVAWYTAQLSERGQVRGYTAFIMSILADADRRYCLQMAAEHDLPMRDIRVLAVESLLSLEVTEDGDEKEHDLGKISALDWLLLEPAEPVPALIQTNALARRFIAEQKVEQANLALEKASLALTEGDFPEDCQHLKECLCLKAYIAAKLAFSDWFEHFHKGRPRKPESLPGEEDKFTTQIASEQRMKRYEADLERWNGALLVQSREVTSHLLNVLNFPDGWLNFDSCGSGEGDDESRKAEVEYLRGLCLVETVFLLHSVYHNTKQYQKAVGLSDLVARSQRAIFTEFTKEDMTKLLQRIRESSVAMMEQQGTDAWGY